MKERIEDFINRFGGRKSASQAEDQAQNHLHQQLVDFCTTAHKQNFYYPLFARFIALRWFGVLHFINLGLYFVSLPLALGLSLINAILFYGQFIGNKGWLNGMFSNDRSSNVIGTLEPREEVHSTIILSGHMDSTKEYIWWYWLGQTGVILTIIASLSIFALPVVYFILLLFTLGMGAEPDGLIIGWGVIALLSLPVITLIFIHGKRVVPGAQDNLSGIVTAFETLKDFVDPHETGKSQLRHTRLKMLSFGSEEVGVVGSSQFAKTYQQTLQDENAHLINLDGIMHYNKLKMVHKEYIGGLTYPSELRNPLAKAFQAQSVPYTEENMLIGGTDGASFMRQGIPAVTILGLNVKHHDPTYHTRIDLPEYVEEEAMQATRQVLGQFVQDWDASI